MQVRQGSKKAETVEVGLHEVLCVQCGEREECRNDLRRQRAGLLCNGYIATATETQNIVGSIANVTKA